MSEGKVAKQTPPNEENFDERFQVKAEEGIPDSGLMDELWATEAGLAPLDEPEEEEEEEEEVGDDGLGQEDSEEEEEEEEAEEEPEEAPDKKFKFKGKEYDLDALVKEGLLDDLIAEAEKAETQSSQVAHYQKLYEEQRRAVEQQLAQQQQAQRQQIPQTLTPDQVKAAMAQQVNQAVQTGFFEPDYVEMYPNAAAAQLMVFNDFQQVKAVVLGMYQHFMKDNAQRAFQTVRNTFDSSCMSLANKHEVYKPLTNDKEREEFFDFLVTKVNPEAGALNDEFLAKQFLAYKHDSVLEAVRSGTGQRKKVRKKKKKLAAGEGGSPRKGPSRTGSQSTDDLVIGGLMEHFDS